MRTALYGKSINALSALLLKLDTDVALVRELDNTNTDSASGVVNCNYRGAGPLCPLRSTWQIAAAFAGDNNLWLVRPNVIGSELFL